MTTDQTIVFAILAVAMVLFIWGRPRYDVVAAAALIAAVLAGVVPGSSAFAGFGHPAVVTVAAVLMVSRALKNAGTVDLLVQMLSSRLDRPRHLSVALVALCAFVSAFMNNVGALAILLPVALETARKESLSPAEILMPLSFGAILGSLATMIGTPPNVIIAAFREETMGAPFSMFDFTPVGGAVALVGIVYLVLVGYRLIPRARRGQTPPEQLFQISNYMAEVRVGEGWRHAGQTIAAFERAAEGEITVTARLRGEERLPAPGQRRRIQPGDELLIQGDAAALQSLLADPGLELAGDEHLNPESLASEDVALLEAVVGHGSALEGRTQGGVGLRQQGLTLLAAARQARQMTTRLQAMRFKVGDVLLLQGSGETMGEGLGRLGLLPLITRGIRLGAKRRIFLALAIFAAALAGIAFGWVDAAVALAAAVALFVVLEFLSPKELYEAVDWPVIVLLGAMIPVGGALQATGAAALLAGGLVDLAGDHATWVLLAIVLALTMTLSDIMNNAATAVVMAPIAVSIANGLGASVDAFLMAVAVGASSAFLTPIGHQCNTLVLGPGGYRFGDYWRVGLPLEILIMAVAVPLILLVWG